MSQVPLRMLNPNAPVLYLDFDGVLHPAGTFLENATPCPATDTPLFAWADHLRDALSAFPTVQLVISSSWARVLGLGPATAYLPRDLQRRVVGMVDTTSPGLRQWTRYMHIARHVDTFGIQRWLAVDDDLEEHWPPIHRHCLVHCTPSVGLSCPETRQQLLHALDQLMAPGSTPHG